MLFYSVMRFQSQQPIPQLVFQAFMGSAQQLYVDLSNRNAFKRLNYKTGNILFRVTEKRLCWKGSIPALFKLLCVSTEQLSTGRAAPQAPLSDEHLQPSSASGFFVPSSLSPAPTVTLISTFRFFFFLQSCLHALQDTWDEGL